MVERIECVVIGAGVVGLATARALARVGREVLVLEASDAIGTETSSRNSEVIHAGIYYPKGSLKARLCVEGKTRLYRYCASRGVPHKRLGKMIVATDAAEDAVLLRLRETARGNGVDDLAPLDAATARAMEPALFCTSALLSPSTGIVDSHQLML
ncbi:MAG: FAD-dependent oxidoreductase, partial [Alphaproteobacteria bacterium]|nr:FAD-dependent oxidoreductase [Alphaproteobacteria bacterium]